MTTEGFVLSEELDAAIARAAEVVTGASRVTALTGAGLSVESGIPPYDEKEDKGVLRHVIIRESRSTGKMLVTIVCARRPRDAKDVADQIAQSLSTVAGVHLHTRDRNDHYFD